MDDLAQKEPAHHTLENLIVLVVIRGMNTMIDLITVVMLLSRSLSCDLSSVLIRNLTIRDILTISLVDSYMIERL
jgi:hypothetical protein